MEELGGSGVRGLEGVDGVVIEGSSGDGGLEGVRGGVVGGVEVVVDYLPSVACCYPQAHQWGLQG